MTPLTPKQLGVLKAVYRGYLLGFSTTGEQIVTTVSRHTGQDVPITGAHRTAGSLVRRGMVTRSKDRDRHVCYSLTALGLQALRAEHSTRGAAQ